EGDWKVIGVGGGDAETDDVDQEGLGFPTQRQGQIFGPQRNNGRSQLLGDGCFRQSSAHKAFRHKGADNRRAPPNFRLLASATMPKVISSMSSPSTAMAARSPLSLRS